MLKKRSLIFNNNYAESPLEKSPNVSISNIDDEDHKNSSKMKRASKLISSDNVS